MPRQPYLASRALLCQGFDMTDRPRAAGGFFLIAAIIAGFIYGMSVGNASFWTVIGLVVGIALALLTWVIDRRH